MVVNELCKVLGMVQDCSVIDLDFLLDDFGNIGVIVEVVVCYGMCWMVLKFCCGWLVYWLCDGCVFVVVLFVVCEFEVDGQVMEVSVLFGCVVSVWIDYLQYGELFVCIE